MTDGSAALKEYLLLLNRFGLSESEVIDLHWSGPVPDDASAGSVVAHVVDDDERTPEALFDRLHRTLAASSKGIETPRQYDPDEPGDQLRTVLEPYNTSVVMRGPSGDRVTADSPEEPVDVVLTDASGESRMTTFAYPEGPLDTNNLPALLHDVETELLADTGMTFVPLTDREDRWRLLLLSEDRLSALQKKYGDRIEVFDRSLLHETSLEEFAEPDPAADEIDDESDAPAWLSDDADSAFEDVGFETAEVEDREDDAGAVETKAIDQDGIDELFASMEETTSPDRPAAGTSRSEEPDVADLVAGDARGESEPESPPDVVPGDDTTPAVARIAVTPAANPTPATSRIAVTPGADPEPAVTPIAVTPSANPTPATSRIAVTPSANPTPATSRIAVTPSADPTPAVARVETEPEVVPADDPRPAASRIGVTPSADPTPAVRAVPSPPSVTPAEDPRPAVEPLAVTPGADPEPAVSAIEPGEPAAPAAEAEAGTPAGATESTEAPAEADATPEPAIAPGTDPDPAVEPVGASGTGDVEAEASAGGGPATPPPSPRVEPTDGEPTPATRLTAAAEAERVVVEDGPAPGPAVPASEPPAEAADTAEAAAEPGPRVAPTDGEPTPAVQEAGAGDEDRGAFGRLAAWLRNLF